MGIELGMMQNPAQLAEALDIRTAPALEKTSDEESRAAKTPEQQGDTLTLSQEARALAAAAKGEESGLAKGESDESSPQEQLISSLEKQIKQLEKEIDDLEKSDLPEKQKQQQIQAKQAQLMQLNDQLLKAQQEELKLSGQTKGGGTRAQGFGNSVADF
ncbi:FlxA-like family protein [Pseudodesulfovibrio pelocollis]|uniref:FlxA-like family protein n=1 Tax=Pseudodesulfovibrio pelocollis TaxID=3051432 RepID=UPI00255AD1AE|nr:FlxA-like family protein [Pseudodesulfovibrio sp. SB368]